MVISKAKAAKWSFWLGVGWFIINAPVSTMAQPVGFFFPLVFTIPYVYGQVKAGFVEGRSQAG